MRFGVYRKVQALGRGSGGVGELYQFICFTGEQGVVYIPLRMVRHCWIRADV